MAQAGSIAPDRLEELIAEYLPLIVRTVSSVTGRYVSVEHDDAFSIALSGFSEAVERFDPERGPFAPFASMVIRSRVLTWMKREQGRPAALSLEQLAEAGQEPAAQEEEEQMQDEIELFVQELSLFHLTLEQLAEQSPRHADTRSRAVSVAERTSQDQPIVVRTYEKRRLPVRPVARLCGVSEKIIKTSRTFILATLLIFVKDLPRLSGWIKRAVM